jgi:hypothetical protein
VGIRLSILFEEVLMTKRSWSRRLFARPVPRPIRQTPHRFHPALEALEDRWVPSAPIGVTNPLDMPLAGGADLRQAIVHMRGGAQTVAPVSTVSSTVPTITATGADPMIVVNNPTDTPVAGQTDLRQAIAQANTNGGRRDNCLRQHGVQDAADDHLERRPAGVE